jgi:hypothetical protein
VITASRRKRLRRRRLIAKRKVVVGAGVKWRAAAKEGSKGREESPESKKASQSIAHLRSNT